MDERTAFETFAKQYPGSYDLQRGKHVLSGEPTDWYSDAATQATWAGWQARAESTSARIEALQAAVDFALALRFPEEPTDSRAVSDQFVAIAAIACDCDREGTALAFVKEQLTALEQDMPLQEPYSRIAQLLRPLMVVTPLNLSKEDLDAAMKAGNAGAGILIPSNVRPDQAELYFEAHITIEPVFDERRDVAAKIAQTFNFRLADLLMKKRAAETEQRSDKDTFMTGHSRSLSDITVRITGCVRALQGAGFTVWRYKIEDTVLDSRTKDELALLAEGHQDE